MIVLKKFRFHVMPVISLIYEWIGKPCKTIHISNLCIDRLKFFINILKLQ